MYEIKNKINSLSLFVGTGQCNAHCKHCAGVPLRKYAPKEDGIINEDLINNTIKNCYEQGARYLSISSSGEPTLSPLSITKTLELIYRKKEESIKFSPINLYSNGIKIGKDESFCNTLSLWKDLNLTTIYLTIHNINEKENAKIYGIDNYPSLNLIISRIHNANLLVRANLVLNKNTIDTLDKFVLTIENLRRMEVDTISAWPIRDKNDEVDSKLSPLENELDKMEDWIENQDSSFKIRLLREKSKIAYQTGQKLTLFPDGTLSNTWCNY